MNIKICNTCKRELPATSEYFYKFKYAKDGFKSSCKECQGGKFIKKEYIPKGYRKCSTCNQILPETEEYFLKYFAKRDNKYYFKGHCLECGKKKCKQWRKTEKDKYKDYYLKHSKSKEAKESCKKYNRTHKGIIKKRKVEYRLRNKDKIKAYDLMRRTNPETREHVLSMTRRWRKNNVDHVSDYNSMYAKENKNYFVKAVHKRNALKRELDCALTLEEWEKTKQYFNNKCAYCGKETKRLTQDHFIPLSKGGAYTKENIIPACKHCNSSKHDSDFEEWYKKQEYYTVEQKNKILNFIKKYTKKGR